jgi:hypothetical protein
MAGILFLGMPADTEKRVLKMIAYFYLYSVNKRRKL